MAGINTFRGYIGFFIQITLNQHSKSVDKQTSFDIPNFDCHHYLDSS